MKKMPVMLTFDVDGEMIWLCRDYENAKRAVTLSLGDYGPNVGLPRILKRLKKYDIPATFFVPGKVAEDYPSVLPSIMEAGVHEIGHHSYSHTYPDKFPSGDAERADYAKATAIIEPIIGKKLKGYRSPAWEFSTSTLDILEEMEIEYSSNMMGTDRIQPLELRYADPEDIYKKGFTVKPKKPIIEIPIHWNKDDAAFWLYSVRIQGKAMQPCKAVEDCWIDEFDCIYEEFLEEVEETGDSDLCFVLTCHPQITGQGSKLKVLENVIKHIMACPNVEFVTCGKAVADYKAKHGID